MLYPHLQGKEQDIVDKIVLYYKEMQDALMYDNCVVDFVIIGDQIKVIEINPFGYMTGESLFNWHADRHILQGGADVFNDNFGKAPTETNTDQPNDDNIPSVNSPIYTEVCATHAFPNGWKTVLRVLNKNPHYVNDVYVGTLFSGVFGQEEKAKGKQSVADGPTAPTHQAPTRQTEKKRDCLLI